MEKGNIALEIVIKCPSYIQANFYFCKNCGEDEIKLATEDKNHNQMPLQHNSKNKQTQTCFL